VIVEVYDAENEKVVERYGIRAIPTQIIFDKDGKEVARNLGYIEKEQILLLLQKVGTY
jgi:thioredoxin 1